jgi:hypothetical protein
MPSKLPDNIKSLVVQKWLAGFQRDKIAFDLGISAGAVTNIINGWRNGLGSYSADELRDMAITLRRIGISPTQCVAGFRVATILRRLGVQEDNFESFMSSVYTRCCNDLGLTPDRIGFYITNLLGFSDTVPFSQIPDYILHKTEEKKRLEKKLKNRRGKFKFCKLKKMKLSSKQTLQ